VIAAPTEPRGKARCRNLALRIFTIPVFYYLEVSSGAVVKD
jgi:hypothetical protein